MRIILSLFLELCCFLHRQIRKTGNVYWCLFFMFQLIIREKLKTLFKLRKLIFKFIATRWNFNHGNIVLIRQSVAFLYQLTPKVVEVQLNGNPYVLFLDLPSRAKVEYDLNLVAKLLHFLLVNIVCGRDDALPCHYKASRKFDLRPDVSRIWDEPIGSNEY